MFYFYMNCPLCAMNPKNHSLKFLKEENNVLYFYSCPGEAIMYFDVEGILYHYDNVFSEIPRDKEWVWIFDASGFGLKHVLNSQVGRRLAELITEKYGDNLKEVLVYGFSSYVSTMYNIIKPFLSEKIQSVVCFKCEPYSSN
jgi:hypothetical protein